MFSSWTFNYRDNLFCRLPSGHWSVSPQDNIMEMRVDDPGRDEILITEPRKSVFWKKILQVFPMDIVSLMDFKVDSVSLMNFKVDMVFLMDFKVDIVFLVDTQMRVEDTGGDEIQIREPWRPKAKFFLKTFSSTFPHDFQIYGGCLG